MVMETKKGKKKPVGQKIEGKEITEGVTGEPFGGKATKPSRIQMEPKGTDKENPFGINSKNTPKRKTKRETIR